MQRKYSVTKIELLAIIKTLKKFKAILWGQSIKMYTDHANLIRDDLGMTLNQVYQWRLLLEEYGPKIIYIKGIHNTVVDTISRLEYDPSINQQLSVTTWRKPRKELKTQSETKLDDSLKTLVQSRNRHWQTWRFKLCICKSQRRGWLTTIEIAEAQHKDQELKVYYKKNAIMPIKDICLQLVEDTNVLCKNGKLIIPASLWHRAVAWYHHYLQHPGHSRLKETMRSVMYWKGMCVTIWRYIKSCRSCQVNKRHSLKYGHVPLKLVITTPWRALFVDLVGPYTLLMAKTGQVLTSCV